jgi:hypothetical protein
MAFMFRRTRERFERLERMLEQLATKLDSPHPPAATATPDAMANLFGSIIKSNVDLVGSMGDLAVRSVARRNGIRGGAANIRTARRDPDGKFLPKSRRAREEPRCALCRYGENYAGVTIDMIQKHRAHLAAQQETQNDRHDETDQSDESVGPGSYRNGSSGEPGN